MTTHVLWDFVIVTWIRFALNDFLLINNDAKSTNAHMMCVCVLLCRQRCRVKIISPKTVTLDYALQVSILTDRNTRSYLGMYEVRYPNCRVNNTTTRS